MAMTKTYVESMVLGAKQAIGRAAALQQIHRREIDTAVSEEIVTLRRALTPAQSSARSDDSLRPEAQRRVLAARLAASREATAAALKAFADAKQTVTQAQADARRLRGSEVAVTREEAAVLLQSDRLVLLELRQLTRALARQEAARRVERVTAPTALFELLQSAESAGDVALAAAAEEQLAGHLAAPPSTAAEIDQRKILRARYDAHRDARMDVETRALVTSSLATVAEAEKDLRRTRDVQGAIEHVGCVNVIEDAA